MRRKNNKYVLLLVLLLCITVGYALVSTTLKINGTTTINKHEWKIYWANASVVEGSVTDTAPTITEDEGDPENTKLSWNVVFSLPGDYYEFTVDAVNDGDIDAMITELTPSVSPALPVNPAYIKYEITYADGVIPEVNHLLAKKTGNTPTTEKYRIRVYYDENAATATSVNAMTADVAYTFSLALTYGMATDDAKLKPALKLGDYFTLVPDEEYATTSIAGFSGSTPTADQTLWRVININSNGTYDAVSEYVSSDGITVTGTDGYKNYIAGLQDIASKYAVSGYTVGTRMTGYDGQTAVIQDTTEFDGTQAPSYTTTTPTPTTGTGEEFGAGVYGDTLYLKDYLYLVNVYNGNLCTTTKTGSNAAYWIASRYYRYNGDSDVFFHGRFLGGIGSNISNNSMRYWGNAWYDKTHTYKVRPIITLKKDVVKNGGNGTKTNPYTFE